MSNNKRPALFCDGGYYGTLAAARTLGLNEVPVLVADPKVLAPALWSRQVARRFRCPEAIDAERFVNWARNVGRKNNRPIFYPTSDDVSLVLALYRSDLEQVFHFYQPGLDTLLNLLDKSRLAMVARAAGLDVPDTWVPHDLSEAEKVIRNEPGPLLIKPRTQSLLNTHSKGAIIAGGQESSVRTYADFARRNILPHWLATRFQEWTLPMIQRYHPEAVERVYSLAGFVDRSGNMAVRGAVKVLQLPRRLGTGLCFQSAEVDSQLAIGLRRLFQQIGYFGVFEAEFIRLPENRSLLIDINGRLYNQLAFDVARGLPLPTLFYEGALGNDGAVAAAIAAATTSDSSEPHAFCNRSRVAVMLGLRRILGTMPKPEVARWKELCDSDPFSVIDAVADPDDPWPRRTDILFHLQSYARHPRAFLRDMGYDQP